MGYKNIIIGVESLLILLQLINRSQAAIFDVKQYGAKVDGKTDDSQAINRAWRDACAAMEASTVVIGKGKYMVGPVRFQGPCNAPITIEVQGTLQAPANVTCFHSQVDWVVFQNVDALAVVGGGTFDGVGALAWSTSTPAKTGNSGSLPINLRFTTLKNSKIQDITSMNSKQYHMNILNCDNVTLENIAISAPGSSPNTNGIHIDRSKGINIVGAKIKTGDDCVSVGDGCKNISIEKVSCGPGHGISVGSLGRYHDERAVEGIKVRNCSLKGTSNGVRIKTWRDSPGGMASNMLFEDITMDNVSNPIFIDQEYCPYNLCQAQVPSKIRISDVSFKGIRGTSATPIAVKLICSKIRPCRYVTIGDIDLIYIGKGMRAISTTTSYCDNVKPTVIGGMFPPACSSPVSSF